MVDPKTAVSAIDTLADVYGIEGEFVDAHGQTQRISTETKQALLLALGASASDEDAARHALDALERAAWLRAVPPVLVTTQPDAPVVPITLASRTETVSWQLLFEDGSERSGSAEFAQLELVETRSFDEQALQRRGLALPAGLPYGYHRLRIDGAAGELVLIVAPAACVLPDDLLERNGWGVAIQLYALRSARNWGIGDYSDLQRLIGIVAGDGADVIGLNPLHAMFLDDPDHASPYSPREPPAAERSQYRCDRGARL